MTKQQGVSSSGQNDGTRPLGRTGIRVTPIGLGAWQFSEGKGGARGSWKSLTPAETDEIVGIALEGGMNWFDTAELYGFGRSERGLSRALQRAGRANGDVVIATKWNPILRTARSITNTIEKRLAFLEPFSIDLHQVHFPASLSSIESEMNAMAGLLESGKIRAVGVSNFSAEQMRRAHEALVSRGFVLASNQVKYSVLDRRIESNGTLDTARELGITIIAYSPLEMGLLSGKFHEDPSLLQNRPIARRFRLRRIIAKSRSLITALEEIAAARKVSVSQVALNWLVNVHGEIVVTIPGATKTRHARESAGAMGFTLSKPEMERIDELSRAFC
jgi:aryl-alcohol dehydrogenase-like predicted oxidoreductase